MRQIKLRAWDKKAKDMVSWLCMRQMAFLDDNFFYLMFNYPNYILMQYIGLKDKNGKEIFEGDIVKVHIFTQELGENLGVMEGEKEFIVEIEFGSNGVCLITNGENSGPIWSYGGFHEESLEVIGNIYENAELLDNK